VDEIVGGLRLLAGRSGLRIENVKADVSLDHFGHQCIHSTPAGGDVVQHVGTFGLLIERPFDGLCLASDSPYAMKEFFFSSVVCAIKNLEKGLYKYTPPGI
jgi:hypothetical protein